MIKLRTMVDNAEAQTGPVWSTGNDSRTTPLGRLLRKTHIDEFPQLLNVLFGQMSLVGPRPERPEFVASLEREVPGYRQRLDVQPGITGLAQLRLPPDTDIESVRRKIVFDLHYVQWVSPWLDLHLLVLTAWSLIRDLCRCAGTCVKLPIRERRHYGVQ
jgi:lipopolysaccharide/colanic/teichoic acid biosynthesis glycosyltransferase